MTQWLQGLNLDKIQTLIVAFVEKLKYSLPDHEQLHVVGHCFGGIQAFQLACHPFATSVVVMHPVSLFTYARSLPYSAELMVKLPRALAM